MTDSAGELDTITREALVGLVIRGVHRGAVTSQQQSLVDQGLAMVKGPLVMPTAAGTASAQAATRLPSRGVQEIALRPLLEKFLPVNHQLRELCTSWQVRGDGTPNDHSDAAYDAAVRDRLDDIDDAIGRILRRMSAVTPSLANYRDHLSASLAQFDEGDTRMLTSPLCDSYHTVWMWLHQELLLLLGISRAEDAKLEAELVAGQLV